MVSSSINLCCYLYKNSLISYFSSFVKFTSISPLSFRPLVMCSTGLLCLLIAANQLHCHPLWTRSMIELTFQYKGWVCFNVFILIAARKQKSTQRHCLLITNHKVRCNVYLCHQYTCAGFHKLFTQFPKFSRTGMQLVRVQILIFTWHPTPYSAHTLYVAVLHTNCPKAIKQIRVSANVWIPLMRNKKVQQNIFFINIVLPCVYMSKVDLLSKGENLFRICLMHLM